MIVSCRLDYSMVKTNKRSGSPRGCNIAFAKSLSASILVLVFPGDVGAIGRESLFPKLPQIDASYCNPRWIFWRALKYSEVLYRMH
jgi:hypothetical protein